VDALGIGCLGPEPAVLLAKDPDFHLRARVFLIDINREFTQLFRQLFEVLRLDLR